MDNAPNGPTPAWKVGRISDTTLMTPGQGFVRAKQVEFQLLDGSASFVTVPLSEFTPARVEQLINEHAEQLYAVKNLQGPLLGP